MEHGMEIWLQRGTKEWLFCKFKKKREKCKCYKLGPVLPAPPQSSESIQTSFTKWLSEPLLCCCVLADWFHSSSHTRGSSYTVSKPSFTHCLHNYPSWEKSEIIQRCYFSPSLWRGCYPSHPKFLGKMNGFHTNTAVSTRPGSQKAFHCQPWYFKVIN